MFFPLPHPHSVFGSHQSWFLSFYLSHSSPVFFLLSIPSPSSSSRFLFDPPPLIFPFYPHWPHFLLVFFSRLHSPFGHFSSIFPKWPLSAPSPRFHCLFFLFCSLYPSIMWWLLSFPSPCAFAHSLLHYLCLSIYQSIHLSIGIYLPSILPFVTQPSCPQIQSSFAPPSLALSSPSWLSLSTSLFNSNHLPSLLPFDTLSPRPLMQSSLLYRSHSSFHSSRFHSFTDNLSQYVSLGPPNC